MVSHGNHRKDIGQNASNYFYLINKVTSKNLDNKSITTK